MKRVAALDQKEQAMKLIRLCITMVALALVTPAIAAYPERPIRIIVPFAPGGTADLVARILGEALSQELRQQVVVDNRGGAGGAVGTQLAARATPDGHTLLLHNVGLAVSETLQPDRGYDALKSLAPVGLTGSTPSVLVVNSNAPFKTVGDWLAAARKQPGRISFGSAGSGSSTHLSMAYLQSAAKIQLLHVPYKGGGPAVQALMGGEVNCVLSPTPTVSGHLKAGRLRALGVTSAKRSPALPDLPTIAESGVPGFSFEAWYALLTTAGTPKPIIQRINAAVRKALESPEVARKLQAAGLDPAATSAESFGTMLRAEIEKWRKVVTEAGITAQ
jgi:tripartite-type tricarboxylate transporter receptor subunit TctC